MSIFLKLMPRSKKWTLCMVVFLSTLMLWVSKAYFLKVSRHLSSSHVKFNIDHAIVLQAEKMSTGNKKVAAQKTSATAFENKIIEEDTPPTNDKLNFVYNINEELKCSQHVYDSKKNKVENGGKEEESLITGPFLLILVSSAPEHFDRRLAIRQAWGNHKIMFKKDVVMIFLVGIPDQKYQVALNRESAAFHDVIQGNFTDTYYNLSIKSVMGLHWARNFCPEAEFVMKTDDDVYINLELLVDFLKIFGRRRWIGGCIKQLKSLMPFNKDGLQVAMVMGHPPFVAGAGYVLSGDIVSELYDAAQKQHLVPVEDAFITAYCAKVIGVAPTHYEGFNCGEPLIDECLMKSKFVAHHVAPEKQLHIWRLLHDAGGSCNKN